MTKVWWVESDDMQYLGPYESLTSALITRRALENLVDSKNWTVYAQTVELEEEE